MADFLHKLPSVLVVGVLVGIFISLRRHNPSTRLKYWLAGWLLIFLHFFVPLFQVKPGLPSQIAGFFDIWALQMAGITFLISVTKAADVPFLRRGFFLTLAVPATIYTALDNWELHLPWAYIGCLAVIFFGGALWTFLRRSHLKGYYIWVLMILALGSWAMVRAAHGDADSGFLAIMLATYGFAALMFALRYPRWSPGVVATVGGFLLWAGVWAVSLWAERFANMLPPDSELWNVPKYFVAFGMIVTLLEDEYRAARAAGERERELAVQIQRFSDVTSRLLSGPSVAGFCNYIAEVLVDATSFHRATILLADDHHHLYIAGQAGVTPDVIARLQDAAGRLTADVVEDMCQTGRRLGQNSFVCHSQDLEPYGSVPGTNAYGPNPNWRSGDELLVPLRTPRGTFVGCITLDEPRDVERINSTEMSKIEMLGADLAVALENETLQRQLVLSEKLAGVGKLVSGIAHELNNPLTAVLGYSEMLNEKAADETSRRELGIVRREALRMKRIIENLLRFAQQSREERQSVDLGPLLEEVLEQRAQEMTERGIKLVRNVDGKLPRVSGDEQQLKQVFANVLNNALEAVEKAGEKRITVEANLLPGRVLLSFVDSGPGFTDIDRIFDPFFTTKGVGKGTGLGLSVCYGILKQHGGDISAHNMHPHGARISIELPIAQEKAEAVGVAADGDEGKFYRPAR